MSLTKDGFYKSFSGAIGNNNYLLEAGGGHIGWGNAASQIPYSNGTVNSNLNADMVDGLHVHGGRNNEANKIVRTDGSGYIQAGWINTTSGDMGSTAFSRIYVSNDAYIRYVSVAQFKTSLFGGQVGSPSVPIYWTGSAFATCIVSFGNQSYGEHNANNINDNGIKYYNSNGPSTSLGATTSDGALYSQAYSTSWVAQIAQDYRNGGLYVRGKNNGTWQSWYRVWDNRTTYVSGGKGYIGSTEITQINNSDTVDGYHASGLFTTFGNSRNNITATIGGTTKTFTVNYANYVNLLYPTFPDTTTTSRSTWSIPSGCRQVWGQRFSDNTLKYTPSGGSATTITDTGDWTIWLAPNATSNAATLNMRIDGTYYGSFSGNLSGTATNTTNIYIEGASGNVNYPLLFTTSTGNGNGRIYADTQWRTAGITFNPSSNTLNVGSRITSPYANHTQTSMRHIDAGLNSVSTDHGLYIGYGAQTYTAVTHFYYSTGTTDSISSRTEFMQINSNGAYALTRFGVNGQNTGYNFYVNGTSFFNNVVRIQYNTPNLYIRNTVDTSYSIIRLGTNSNENASYIFQNGPSRTDDGGANVMTIRNNVGVLRLQNRVHIDSTGRIYPEGTNSRRMGMYGVYDSTKLGHIWSMGTGYMISDNGADPANLYGLAYFHTNWSNNATYNTNAANKTAVGTYAGNHQVGWFINGVLYGSIGDYIWSRNGFIKNGSNNNYVLLGGGGHKALSDFSMAHSHPYLPLAGGTMNSGAQIIVGSISNSSGNVYNGGIQLRERGYATTSLDGTVYTDGPGITFHWGGRWVHMLNMHSNDIFWDNNKIWHAGNAALPNKGTANRIAWYNGAASITSGSITTDGSYLGNVSYLSINTAHQTGYRLYVNGTSWLGGTTYQRGVIYLASGTTYYIDNSALGYLNDLRVDQTRLVDNWIGFYQSNNAGGSRYGYIQANADRMYFRKENGVSTYHFDFAGHVYVSQAVFANTVYANISGSSTANGISLYSNSDPMTYGISFRGTGSYGKLQGIQSDWATYLTMNDDTSRGWMFRRGSTNVLAIDGFGSLNRFYIYRLRLPGATAKPVGWYQMCRISGLDGYFNFNLLCTGGWSTGAPSMALLNIACYNTTPVLTQISGKNNGVITKIRLRNISGGDYYLDVYQAYGYTSSNKMSDEYFLINGSVRVTEIAEPTSVTTATGGTELAIQDISGHLVSREHAYWANLSVQTTTNNDTQPRFGYVGIGASVNTSYRLYVNGTSWLGGTTYQRGVIYLASGTTYYIDNSAVGYLNDLRVDQTRLVDNWIGFYQSNNAGGNRYGYIQADGSYMYFRKENGNSGFNFNGHIVPSSTNAFDLGSSSLRWRKLYIGTTDSYGSTTKPIYWNAGVPTACTYELKTTVNSGTANRVAWYNGSAQVASTNIITDSNYLSNISYLSVNTGHQTSYRLYVNGTGYFTGQLHAKVAQGTSPLAVTSTTLVSNLNTDLLDGYHANRFAFTYNSANYGSSSGVTVNDLVTNGVSNASHGMIYAATDNPVGSSNWVHVWSQQWTIATTSSWVSQIALGVQQGTGMWYRTTSGNIVGRGWTRVLDSSNWTSYGDGRYLFKLRRDNLNISSTDAGMIPPALLELKNGYPIYTDPEFTSGNNSVSVYNNSGGTAVTITRQADSTAGNSSGYVLKVHSAASSASPYGGGWYFATGGVASRVYVCIFRAKIPSGYNVVFHTNSIGSGANSGWLTQQAGTGKWEWYAYMVEFGTSPSSTFFFTLNAAAAVDWYLSYANVIWINNNAYDGLRTRYSDEAAGARYIFDRSNGTATYSNYGAAGLGLGSITWLTCWNGYELRAISKGELGGLTNVYQHTGNNVDYPLVWSNQNNTSTVQANQLHKSYADLVYNPYYKTIKTAGGYIMGNASGYFIYRDFLGGSNLEAGFYFHSSGRESVVFANQYAHTGWIFVNGIKPSNRTQWNALGVTPAVQIHHNALYINRSVRDADTADYNLFVNGTSYLNGQVKTWKPAQSWIGGMTNAAILFGDGSNIDASSYWPFWSMKDSSGNVVNWGGLGNMLGFHGYYVGRTSNDCDWRWRVNASNGYWEMLKAYGVWHPSYQSINYVLTSNGDAKKWNASYEANTIVARDGNGYIYATYYNSAIGDENPTIGSVYIRNTSDNYIRRMSRANFGAQMRDSGTMDGRWVLKSGDTMTGALNIKGNGSTRANLNLVSSGNVPNDLYFGSNNSSHWSISSRESGDPYIGLYNVSQGWAIKVNYGNNYVGIGTTSPSYRLHISGDSYTTGWSRAASGFYVHDQGVHYTYQQSGMPLIYLTSNEFNFGQSGSTLYFNYRASRLGTTTTNYVWNAGSSSSWASHNMGNIWLNGSGVYVRIGPQNSSHAHYETNAGTSHWFNKRVDVNGAIWRYGTNYGIENDGRFYALAMYANRSASSTDGGVSLYGTDFTYSILFRGTGWGGKLGRVQADWATYLTMDGTAQRGWIFRNSSLGNVASISNAGEAYYSSIGRDYYIAYPNGGQSVGNGSSVTGAIAIYLPTTAFKCSTMLKFTIEIYEYSGTCSTTYTVAGYNYSDSQWYNTTAYSLRQGTNGKGNLRVRFGDDGSTRNIIWIGETDTTWSYPQVYIKDVTLGHSNYDYNRWAAGWSIGFVTSFGNVRTYIDNPAVNYYANNADSASNADTVDGYHSNRFAFTYNSANYGNSSGVTVNDLVTNGVSNASHGMIYSATDNPVGSSNWVHVWSQQWTIATTSSWVSQIALGVQQGTGMWYRTTSGNVVGRAWTRVLDSSNWTSYGDGRYVKKAGDTMTGALYINYAQDVGLNQNGSLIIGNKASTNLAFDDNEIMARNNSAASILYINAEGGTICLNGGAGYTGIGTDSPSYKLHVAGDSYTTGWSRAGTGFYCEGNGVHFTHNGTVGQISMTSNNEFNWGASDSTLYFNYRSSSIGSTVTNYIWNAGTASSFADHTIGSIHIKNGQKNVEHRDASRIIDLTNYTTYVPSSINFTTASYNNRKVLFLPVPTSTLEGYIIFIHRTYSGATLITVKNTSYNPTNPDTVWDDAEKYCSPTEYIMGSHGDTMRWIADTGGIADNAVFYRCEYDRRLNRCFWREHWTGGEE